MGIVFFILFILLCNLSGVIIKSVIMAANGALVGAGILPYAALLSDAAADEFAETVFFIIMSSLAVIGILWLAGMILPERLFNRDGENGQT